MKIQQNTTKSCKILKNNIFECGKSYPYRASLYNHRKKCTKSQEIQNSTNNDGENNIKMALSESEKATNKDLGKQPENNINQIDTNNIDTNNIDYHSMIIRLIDQNAEFKKPTYKTARSNW